MNKRITSLALVLALVMSLLVTAVPAKAAPIESTELKVTADTTSAKPGDIITYTITMGPVSDLGTLQMDLDIPDKLTYVENSGQIADGVKATLGFDTLDWTEVTKRITGAASAADYSSATDTVLATFQCKVNSNAIDGSTLEVGLKNLEFYSCQDWTDHTDRFSVVKAAFTVSIPHTHVYDQEVVAPKYLKDSATCTAPAVYYKSCSCGETGAETFTSGSPLDHDFTVKTETEAYLKKAAANCQEYNEYWYACSRCDISAEGINNAKYYTSTTAGKHSFTEKIADAAHHVAGTGTDCKTPDKYYYDCAYCAEMSATDTWTADTYGSHDYEEEWSYDASGHWHECSVCGDKKDGATHTPDRPAATETEPVKCTECGYTIASALGHTCKPVKVEAVDPTCTTDGNIEYYKCTCGKLYEDAQGTVEITDPSKVVDPKLNHDWAPATCTAPKTCKRCGETEGIALGHDYASTWSSDADGHWHECTRCGDKKDGDEHTPDRDAATEFNPIKCSECGYEIAPARGCILEMTVSIAVKLTGDKEPGKETFRLEIYDCVEENAEFEILNDTVVAENLEFNEDGVAFIAGTLKIKVTSEDQLHKLTEGFNVRMVKGTAKGWTYASEQWYVAPVIFDDVAFGIGYDVREIVDGEISDTSANGMSFTLGYEAVTESQSPQTGDSSMMGLWIALLAVSVVGLVGTMVYGRKKEY